MNHQGSYFYVLAKAGGIFYYLKNGLKPVPIYISNIYIKISLLLLWSHSSDNNLQYF